MAILRRFFTLNEHYFLFCYREFVIFLFQRRFEPRVHPGYEDNNNLRLVGMQLKSNIPLRTVLNTSDGWITLKEYKAKWVEFHKQKFMKQAKEEGSLYGAIGSYLYLAAAHQAVQSLLKEGKEGMKPLPRLYSDPGVFTGLVMDKNPMLLEKAKLI